MVLCRCALTCQGVGGGGAGRGAGRAHHAGVAAAADGADAARAGAAVAAPLPALAGAAGPLPGAVLADVAAHLEEAGREGGGGGWAVSVGEPRVRLLHCSPAATHLLELLVRQAVELDDELAVGGGDLGAGVDDLDDVQLLPQAHFGAHPAAQVLDVLHLEARTRTQSSEAQQSTEALMLRLNGFILYKNHKLLRDI